MNFLAHALLSGDDGDLLLGNLMTDFLRPDPPFSAHPRVLAGVERHYAIDHFMDSHPVVARSRARLFPFYRHYSAVLVDVFYDHLLARNWGQFHAQTLPDFAGWVYAELGARRDQMPAPMQGVVPAMIADDWLCSYAHPDGVRYALNRVRRRSPRAPSGEDAWATFADGEGEYTAEFLEFFPQIVARVQA